MTSYHVLFPTRRPFSGTPWVSFSLFLTIHSSPLLCDPTVNETCQSGGILLLGATALPWSREEELQSPISLAGTLECPLLIPNPPGAPQSLPNSRDWLHHQPVGTHSPLPASPFPPTGAVEWAALGSSQTHGSERAVRWWRCVWGVPAPWTSSARHALSFGFLCTTNMWSIHPGEGSTRQIYRVAHRCNRPCNSSAAPAQPLP